MFIYRCRPAWSGSWCQLCSGLHIHPEGPHVFPPLCCWRKVPIEVKQSYFPFLVLYKYYPSAPSFRRIGRHWSHGYWNGFFCSNHCLCTYISNNRLVKTFFMELTNKGISPQFSKKRHNKHGLNPFNLQGQRSPLLSFVRVSGKLLLSPLAWSPSPTALGTLLIRWRSVVCSICSFPIASTSHSSKPFHFLSAFGAITNRWALVICCTLHCQQRSQDKWLTSSIAWETWDCTSRFTQLFQRWQFAPFVFLEKGPLDSLTLFNKLQIPPLWD